MAGSGWTEREVCAQTRALAEQVEIGVLQEGRMVRRQGAVEEVTHLVPWLSWRNASGAHIYVRPLAPAGTARVILVDDLEACAVRAMIIDGMAPAAVIETSPANYQAWVRLSAEPIAAELATAAARVLAQRYRGDTHCAVATQLGRLAGFTNRKECRRVADGSYPWVRVRRVDHGVAPAAASLLAEASVHAQRREAAPIARFAMPEESDLSAYGQLFTQEAARLQARYGAADPSRLEWMITLDLARRFPALSGETLGRALYEGGRHTDLAARKQGHVADYISRTVSRALAQAARERAAWRGARSATTPAQQRSNERSRLLRVGAE